MNGRPRMIYILGSIAVILGVFLFVKLVDGGYFRSSTDQNPEQREQIIETENTDSDELDETINRPDGDPETITRETREDNDIIATITESLEEPIIPTNTSRKELIERVPYSAKETPFSRTNPIDITNFSASLDREPVDDVVQSGSTITLNWNVKQENTICAIIGDQYLFGFQLVEPVGSMSFLIDDPIPFSSRAYLSPTLRCAGTYEELVSPELIVYRTQESIDTRTFLPAPTVCDTKEPGIYIKSDDTGPRQLSGGDELTIKWISCGISDTTPVYFTLINSDLKQIELSTFTSFQSSEHYNNHSATVIVPDTTPPDTYHLRIGAVQKSFSVFDEIHDAITVDTSGFSLSRCVYGQFLDITFDSYSSPLVVENPGKLYELGQFTVTPRCNISINGLEVTLITTSATDSSITLYEDDVRISAEDLYTTTTSQPLDFLVGSPRTFTVRGTINNLDEYSFAIQRIDGFSTRDPYFTELAGLGRPKSSAREVHY